jgi:hypothetical protein
MQASTPTKNDRQTALRHRQNKMDRQLILHHRQNHRQVAYHCRQPPPNSENFINIYQLYLSKAITLPGLSGMSE